MSHSANVFSPPGTPLQNRTVGELVAEHPGLSRVFQSCGIDFCCQGGRTLREACERKGLALAEVIHQLQAQLEVKNPDASNPASLPIHELTEYIVEKHHGFLRRELPRLHAMSARVAQVHGGRTPALVEMDQVFQGLESELTRHLDEEENILFPAVAAISRGEALRLPLDGPIAAMMGEHEEAGAALSRLRELSNGFRPPADACNTYRALFAGLRDVEEDLHRHIHLENSVLFPAAQALTETPVH